MIGFGGAGKAILSFLDKKFGSKHYLSVFNRSTVSNYIENYPDVRFHDLPSFDYLASEFDLIINATSLGYGNFIDIMPIDHSSLSKIKSSAIVYDIIYDPIKSKLLKESEGQGNNIINGLRMNLIQAVFAFHYTNNTNFSVEE